MCTPNMLCVRVARDSFTLPFLSLMSKTRHPTQHIFKLSYSVSVFLHHTHTNTHKCTLICTYCRATYRTSFRETHLRPSKNRPLSFNLRSVFVWSPSRLPLILFPRCIELAMRFWALWTVITQTP